MPATGLRERKKHAAMRRIQDCALALFDDAGYDAVTIEQVAEAAEVSPSSVYRYFGTKEQILLWDDYDPELMTSMACHLRDHPPVEALRRAIAEEMTRVFDRDEERVRRRLDYVLGEPALRAASTEQNDAMTAWAAVLLADSAGRHRDDLEVQVVANALVASLVAALRHWHASGYARPLQETFDLTFAVLDRGLRVG
jgi:AcrR family transcriptional regulator